MNKYIITIIYTQQKKFSTIQENFRKRISRNLRNVSIGYLALNLEDS